MKLAVNFNEVNSQLDIQFIQSECTFATNFGEIFQVQQTTENIYGAPYNAIPRVHDQVLYTKNKLLTDNITIEVIPLTTVVNQGNGYTAVIG